MTEQMPKNSPFSSNVAHIAVRKEIQKPDKQGKDSVFSDESDGATGPNFTQNSTFRTIQIPQEELWATSQITGKGKFITNLSTKEAYRTDWRYVTRKGSKEALTKAQTDKIISTESKYKIKQNFIAAVSVAKTVGQCILALIHSNPIDKKGPMILRIAPYSDMDVDFDENFLPKTYHVYMKFGHNRYRVHIAAEDCIAFVNEVNPLENGTIGTSDLLAVYFPIRWSMNMLDGFSKIVLQRGLGFLDVEVTGAQPADLTAYEAEFGDPTQYSSLFHDEKVKVTAIAGMSQGHNIADTLKIYTREISSGSGIGENRLDGVQTYVTGAATDQDNYAAIGVTTQQTFYDAQVALFKRCDPTLPDFAIEMPIEIRMDKMQEAELRATEIRTIMEAPQLFKMRTAMERLGQDAPEGEEGELSVAQYIESQSDFNEENPENFDDTITDPNSPNENQKDQDNSQNSQQKQVPAGRTLNVSKIKKERAKDLFKETGDSIPNVRAAIIKEFGSGLSNSDLVEIRAEIQQDKQSKDA